tara:strand:+ start:805 stop:1419 length:615 start_codon:yes stop_codon:yes gene_type:complete
MDLNMLNKISNKVEKYNAQLLPVIKDRKFEDIIKIYNLGFEEFGENRLKQLKEHKNKLQDAKFHYIASLQSRKINEIMDNCISIHTLSRKKEAKIINKYYSNQKIFVQVNIDSDPKKNGIIPEEVDSFFNIFEELAYFPVGIMCIPSLESNPKNAFAYMQKINEKLKNNYKGYFGELSMGMSDDYEIALDYGATIVRIGSKIFN